MLDAGGLLWVDPPSLTLSFPADGTPVAQATNTLHDVLDGQFDRAIWQGAVERAFQTWADAIGGAVTVVEDGGQPLGAPGLAEGDPRFGDIRIVAVPLDPSLTAMSVPQSAVVSGTWAGDVLFNSAVDFTNIDDFYSVALHEAGHVFGLDHSTDPASPMFTHGISANLAPTADDVAKLKSLYGIRGEQEGSSGGSDDHDQESEDAGGSSNRNDSLFFAEALTVPVLPQQLVRYEVSGSISTPDDIDYFVLQPSSIELENNEILTVTVRSATVNGVILDATVYDDQGREVEATVLRNDNGVLVVQAESVEPDERVFIGIRSDGAVDPYRTGDYDLVASYRPGEVKLTEFASMELDEESLRASYPMHVDATQLGFFIAKLEERDVPPGTVASVVVYDDRGTPVYRAGVEPGQSRSAPTILLEPGEYRIDFEVAFPAGETGKATIVFDGDGISLPFGPGLTDPTTSPVLPCNQAGADPAYCLPPDSVVTSPIVIWPGTPKLETTPVTRLVPPVTTPDRWFWDGARAIQNVPRHLPGRPTDVNNDGLTTPRDALVIVKFLEATQRGETIDAINWYVDVNNDGAASPIDLLFVITAIAI